MSAPSADRAPEAAGRIEVVLRKAGRTKMRYAADLLADDGRRITVRAPGRAPAYATSVSSASHRVTSSPSTSGATAGTR